MGSQPWPAVHLYHGSTQWEKVAGPFQVHIQTSAPCQVIPGRIRKSQASAECVKVQARGCLATAALSCSILWSSPHHPQPCSRFGKEPCRFLNQPYLGMVGGGETVRGTGGLCMTTSATLAFRIPCLSTIVGLPGVSWG